MVTSKRLCCGYFLMAVAIAYITCINVKSTRLRYIKIMMKVLIRNLWFMVRAGVRVCHWWRQFISIYTSRSRFLATSWNILRNPPLTFIIFSYYTEIHSTCIVACIYTSMNSLLLLKMHYIDCSYVKYRLYFTLPFLLYGIR